MEQSWIIRFLRWFCPAHLLEEIEGDLLQRYERDLKSCDHIEKSDDYKQRRAKNRLLWSTIRFFRPGIILRSRISSNSIDNSMIKSHFLFAIRLLLKNKAFAFVSVFGLSISIAAFILLADYTRLELSYDRFFSQQQNIYRLQHNRIVNGEVLYKKAMNLPEAGFALKEYFPVVEEVARLFPVSVNIEPVFTATLKSGEKKSFSEPNAYSADSTFCRIFNLDFIYGNSSSALSDLDKIIISQSTALRYFGRLDVIGEILSGKDGDLTITGVFHDLPVNSHFNFDVLLSWFDVYEDRSKFTYDGFYTYVLLKQGTDIIPLSHRLPEFAKSYLGEYYKDRPNTYSQFELQPLNGIHLDSHLDGEMEANGNRNIVNALLVVAAFMLIIAVINQVNLNTSRSLVRLKEIGVRKVIGSTKTQLSAQFLIEALLVNVISVSIGLLMAWLLYPRFNSLFNTHISLALVAEPYFWIALVATIFLVSMVSGFYPAFVLARFKVFEAIKGLSKGSGKSYFQRALVSLQFTISLVLIVVTFALLKQVTFMQNKDLGFNLDQKLVVKVLPTYGEENDSSFNHRLISIKNELLTHTLCKTSTVSSSIPGRKNEWRGSTRLAETDITIRANLTRVDEDFLKAFDLKILAGRGYESSLHNETSIIVNNETTKQFGFNTPDEAIGKKVTMLGEREIIGVVESFHEAGLQEALSPSMYVTGAGYMKYLTISLTRGNTHDQVMEIEKIWSKNFPEKPFQYFFLDEFFNRQYQADVLMSKSLSLFSGIAVAIACLGLFSLSIYTIYRKTKEIGIKKILGASTTTITHELCRNFMLPVSLSAFSGLPVSHMLIVWWLKQYAYRVEITLALYMIPLLILIIIGFCTVVFQSIHAAKLNPVDSLRYE